MRHCIKLAFCVLAFGFANSCVSEPKEKAPLPEEILPGYWELIDAKRNGKDIPSLKGAYFEFDTSSTISSNWSGEQVVSDYTIVDNAIVYQDADKEQKLDFTIYGHDTLLFKTVLRKIWNIELTLLRGDKENK